MTDFSCPLCKQPVSKQLYDKITGIWQEKEVQMARLREQEKKLKERGARMAQDYKKNTAKLRYDLAAKAKQEIVRIAAVHRARLDKQRAQLEKRMRQVQKIYERQTLAAVGKARSKERAALKAQLMQQKNQFDAATKAAVQRERDRLRTAQARLKRHEAKIEERHTKLLKSMNAMREKSSRELETQARRIKSLEKQLKERETAQGLGRLEEDEFLARLKKAFPADRCEKTPGSRGGDILHFVTDGGVEVGLIVYELKTGPTFSKAHVDQALKAKRDRKADYGLLVTEARRPKDPAGIAVSKDVVIVHHAGALVVADILRKHLVSTARLKLGATERRLAVKAVLAYVQGACFRNAVEGIIQESIDLAEELRKEVTGHVKTWKYRMEKYRSIHSNAQGIEVEVARLGFAGKRKKLGIEPIEPIALPESIG